ncbi:MAG: PilZ domain-containing protein [Candidatus Omnitrophica bacterium]|nr:PilZ domain-containing protein [Candidatus Omnitrophota bacterium]
MPNRRKFVRFEVEDILEVRPLSEVARKFKSVSKDFSVIGICFFSDFKWEKGQVLLIEYFLPEDLEAVKLKAGVVWSEFIDDKKGFLVGVEILDLEDKHADKFTNYYFRKVRERFFE